MIHRLLFALFFVLFASRPLGFDVGLAPGLSVKNAALYIALVTLAIELAITRRAKLELLPVFVPFALYVLYAIFTVFVIALLVDLPRYSAIQALMSLKAGPMEHMLVLLIFFYGIADSKQAMWVLRRMVWLIVLFNLVSVLDILNILNLGVASEDKGGRLGGTIGSSNEFAYFLAFFLPTIVALYWDEKGVKRLIASLGAVISVLAFLMAVSRGAFVGLVIGGVIGAYYLRAVVSPQVLVRAGFGAIMVCVVALAGAFATDYGNIIVERFGELGGNTYDASSGRTVIWAQALNRMLEHPLSFITGFGWHSYDSTIEFRHATHNVYLNILYNLGMIGVVLFLVTAMNVIRAVRAAVNRADSETRSYLMAFLFGYLALLFCIFFGGVYTSWLYIWAFVGVSLRLAVCQPAIAADEQELTVGRPDSVTRMGATL